MYSLSIKLNLFTFQLGCQIGTVTVRTVGYLLCHITYGTIGTSPRKVVPYLCLPYGIQVVSTTVWGPRTELWQVTNIGTGTGTLMVIRILAYLHRAERKQLGTGTYGRWYLLTLYLPVPRQNTVPVGIFIRLKNSNYSTGTVDRRARCRTYYRTYKLTTVSYLTPTGRSK